MLKFCGFVFCGHSVQSLPSVGLTETLHHVGLRTGVKAKTPNGSLLATSVTDAMPSWLMTASPDVTRSLTVYLRSGSGSPVSLTVNVARWVSSLDPALNLTVQDDPTKSISASPGEPINCSHPITHRHTVFNFCYASAAYAAMRCLSVCLSVSRSWILSKRINVACCLIKANKDWYNKHKFYLGLSSNFFHHRVATYTILAFPWQYSDGDPPP